MYRQGLTTTQIAATARVGKSIVRYHLAIAAKAYASIGDEHRNAARTAPVTRVTAMGLRNLNDTVAPYGAEGRLPSSHSSSARDRALATWLVRRRQDHDQGTLSPTYSTALQEIPTGTSGPAPPPTKPAGTNASRSSPPIWPPGTTGHTIKGTDTDEERLLGMWLHIQRMKYRRHELNQDKESQLNTLLPGWRDGRTRGRPPGSSNIRRG